MINISGLQNSVNRLYIIFNAIRDKKKLPSKNRLLRNLARATEQCYSLKELPGLDNTLIQRLTQKFIQFLKNILKNPYHFKEHTPKK